MTDKMFDEGDIDELIKRAIEDPKDILIILLAGELQRERNEQAKTCEENSWFYK